jgi:TRAP-type C4-dicarboxylate transport system permease large subunit
MVVYGFIAEESIGALLLAGILPGLLQASTYTIMLLGRFKANPAFGRPMPRARDTECHDQIATSYGSD